MRKHSLLIWADCLLLGSLVACHAPKAPVGGIIDVNGHASNGPPESLLIDDGGKLIIKLPNPTPPITGFEIKSTLNGTPAQVCTNQPNPFTATGDVSCLVGKTDGDYSITITPQTRGPHGTKPIGPPVTVIAYVRSCKLCK